jgi:hypothetical protein
MTGGLRLPPGGSGISDETVVFAAELIDRLPPPALLLRPDLRCGGPLAAAEKPAPDRRRP